MVRMTGEDVIEIVIAGTPIAQGSKRFIARGIGIESNRDTLMPWRGAVAAKALQAMDGRDPLAGPVAVHVVFHFARPRAHYRTGRHAEELRPDAPLWRASKPDVDKLIRALFDGMTGIVYRDDAQVVEVIARKAHGTPSATVRIWALESGHE